MAFLSYLKRFIPWLLILPMLYWSIDGMYIISTAISGETKQKAIEHIWISMGVLLMTTIGFLIVSRYPIRMFRNSIEGFLIILSFIRTEGKKVGLGQELPGNIKNSNDIKNINL